MLRTVSNKSFASTTSRSGRSSIAAERLFFSLRKSKFGILSNLFEKIWMLFCEVQPILCNQLVVQSPVAFNTLLFYSVYLPEVKEEASERFFQEGMRGSSLGLLLLFAGGLKGGSREEPGTSSSRQRFIGTDSMPSTSGDFGQSHHVPFCQ